MRVDIIRKCDGTTFKKYGQKDALQGSHVVTCVLLSRLQLMACWTGLLIEYLATHYNGISSGKWELRHTWKTTLLVSGGTSCDDFCLLALPPGSASGLESPATGTSIYHFRGEGTPLPIDFPGIYRFKI